MSNTHIEALFDPRTSTLTYVVSDPTTKDAVVIDPVLDYDPASSTTWRESVDGVIAYLNEHQLRLLWVLETHAHADHLSGSQLLKDACPNVKVAIGRRICDVQRMFRGIFALPESFPVDGRQFDKLLDDGEVLRAGSIEIKTMYTPGHTPACATYQIGDALFVGDAIFMPDGGTGRCDFPGGSAHALYDSIARRLYAKPDDMRVFVGHDYQPGGRELAYQTTVGEQKSSNVALNGSTSEADFISFREKRDAQLPAPKLLFQSVQVNIDAGKLPSPEGSHAYLKIPVNVFKPKPSEPAQRLELCEAPTASGRQG
jgi:glyoxylase-like metal-dependent hydrolase (beta-lactamase superfamily II)